MTEITKKMDRFLDLQIQKYQTWSPSGNPEIEKELLLLIGEFAQGLKLTELVEDLVDRMNTSMKHPDFELSTAFWMGELQKILEESKK